MYASVMCCPPLFLTKRSIKTFWVRKFPSFFLKTKVKKKKSGNKKKRGILLLKKSKSTRKAVCILCTPEKLEIGRWCCYKRFYEKFALGKCFNEREESEEEREKRRKKLLYLGRVSGGSFVPSVIASILVASKKIKTSSFYSQSLNPPKNNTQQVWEWSQTKKFENV